MKAKEKREKLSRQMAVFVYFLSIISIAIAFGGLITNKIAETFIGAALFGVTYSFMFDFIWENTK
jgi:hypothetical protein